MCGRFAIFSKPDDYLSQIGLAGQVESCVSVEHYNAYPTQSLPVLYRSQINNPAPRGGVLRSLISSSYAASGGEFTRRD